MHLLQEAIAHRYVCSAGGWANSSCLPAWCGMKACAEQSLRSHWVLCCLPLCSLLTDETKMQPAWPQVLLWLQGAALWCLALLRNHPLLLGRALPLESAPYSNVRSRKTVNKFFLRRDSYFLLVSLAQSWAGWHLMIDIGRRLGWELYRGGRAQLKKELLEALYTI